MAQAIPRRRKESAREVWGVSGEESVPEPGWDHRFGVGDVVRTVGGGGAYSCGEIVGVAEEKYYRVDYGLGFPSLIREENLARFDEKKALSQPPRSFAPPILPFM